MGDVSVRMRMNEDVSKKLRSVASAGKAVASQLSSAGKEIDKAFSSNAPNTFASKAGSALQSVGGEVESLGNVIDNALDGFDDFSSGGFENAESVFSSAADSADDFSDSANEAVDSIDDLKTSAGGLEDCLSGLEDGADGMDEFADSADGAGGSMDDASRSAESFGGALKKLFQIALGAKVLGEVKKYAGESIEIGEDFTSMMSEVQAISGASGSEIAQLENTAREYGATTVFSATEAAEALKYMSLAGWDVNQSTSALGGVLNLAAASGMGLGQASDMVTDYLSAFGMEASKSTYFADMLSFAQSNSNTTAEQLGEAYRNVAANMHAAGQDVETTTSLLEAMANQGYKGSEAGTALAAVMRDITQKMDKGAIKVGKTSVAVQDANGNFRDLTDILTDVESATGGMGDAQRAAALGSTFTADSIKAVNMVFAEGMDTVSGYEDALRSAGGTSEKMAGIMNDNLEGDKANLKSAAEEMQLQVFESMEGPLRNGVQYLTDSVIPTLTEWVPEAFGSAANGIQRVASALSPLIEKVLKNPQAVGTAFASIGAGFVAMKTVSSGFKIANTISDTGGIISSLGKLSNGIFGSPWAAGAATIAAAVTAVGFAVKEYNDLQVKENLNSHFGSISLDTSQVEALAGEIVPVDITADLQLANVTFDEADELVTEAEDVLAQNNYINWKINTIHADVSEADYDTLLTNTETFVSNVVSALEKEEYAAELTVTALLGDVESEAIIGQMQTWFAEDAAAVSSLGNAVTELLQKSIDEGTYNLNTQTAISIMQTKMMDIVNGAKNAELAGKLDWLSLISNGAALDSDSWTDVVKQVGEYQKELTEASAESYQNLFGKLEQAAYNDPSRRGEVDTIKEIIGQAYATLDESSLVQGFSWMHNTLSDAYGNELAQASENMAESTAEYRDTWNSFFNDVNEQGLMNNPVGFFEALQTQAMSFDSGLDRSTQKALLDRYETMFPTVEQMQGKIDEYAEAGKAVPQALMDSYNQAIEIGAAAGNTDAMWQYYAKSLVDSGEYETFMQKVEETGASIPQEFQEALTRATAETSSEDYSGVIDALIGSMSGGEVDWAKVNSILDEYGFSISDALKEQGINLNGEVPVNSDGIEVDMQKLSHNLEGLEATGGTVTLEGGQIAVEYEVTAGQTMSEIAAQAGIALDELIAANPQIENPDIIQIGQKINIPASAVEVDASGVGVAANEAVQSEAGGDTTVEKTVTANTTYVAGETDTSQVQNTATEQLSSETATQEVVTNTTYTPGSIDTSQVTEVTQEKLGTQTVESTAMANVTSKLGTDNFAETASAFAERFQSALTSAFARVFTATTSASITVDYNIANPSKTITFSGGGSGTATVYAHATGGIFEQPHYGLVAEAGPEAIIPLDGSANALDLWTQAGERLGLVDEPVTTSPVMASKADTGSGGNEKNGSKEINININGSGNIRVGGGVSKDEVVAILMDNVKDAIINIVEQDILVEGDGAYEY